MTDVTPEAHDEPTREAAPESLKAARAYLARGLAVFPLNGKVPAVEHGVDDASSDPARVDAWFGTVQRNIGIRTPPGVVVVDVDPRNGGNETLKAWCDEHGWDWLAGVPRAATGGGGKHYWFRFPLGEKLKKTIGGVDFQRDNKYVVAPPSKTVDFYVWEQRLPDDLAELPDLPDWLLELARRPSAPEPGPAAPMREYGGSDELADAAHRYTTWEALLEAHGWLNVGDNRWRHPNSENEFSATITHDCLFVFSPNTPFPVTEDGDPHGVTLLNAISTLEARSVSEIVASFREDGFLAPLAPMASVRDLLPPRVDDADDAPGPNGLRLGGYLDWPEAFAADDDIEQRWLIDPIIALGRSHALYAGAKTGKSLFMLAASAALASGRAFLNMGEHDPVPVLYADYEMTRDDVVERLENLGYAPVDLEHLHYTLLASGNGLDTDAGAADLIHDAAALGVGLVVVDTMSRAVVGAEDENDTIRAFYRCTGAPLKRLGIAVARLDHAGKDVSKGQRGASAKNDDVDVVWRLSVAGENEKRATKDFKLESTHQRMGWVDREVLLRIAEDTSTGLSDWMQRRAAEEQTTSASFDPVVRDAMEWLKVLGFGDDISVRKAKVVLRADGWRGANQTVEHAVAALKNPTRATPADLVDCGQRVDDGGQRDDGACPDSPDGPSRTDSSVEDAETTLGTRFGTVEVVS